MNRKWGDLANKLGGMVEDLVYPSLPRVIQQTVGQEPDRVAIRVKQRGPDGQRKEFDAYAVTAVLCFTPQHPGHPTQRRRRRLHRRDRHLP
ncbi:MAG: hypothetical protein P8Y25_10955 [Chromatiaceae bacterium]